MDRIKVASDLVNLAKELVSNELLPIRDTKKMLKKMGFEESSFDEFVSDNRKYKNKGFKQTQVDPFEKNIKNLKKTVGGKIKKYYIVKLSRGRFAISAWSYLD